MVIIDNIIELTRFARKQGGQIIGVDGSLNSGKSTLIAPALQIAIGAAAIHLDHYLHRHAGSYIHSLKYGKLKEDIARARTHHDHVVIEGVMLLQALHHVYVRPDIVIYAADSFWYDQWRQYRTSRMGAQRIISYEERLTNTIQHAIHPKHKFTHLSRVRRELYRYTHDYRPQDQADALFLIDNYL